MNDHKLVDLLEDVDLKNLKAEVVPAGVLYPATLKTIGMITLGFAGIFFGGYFLLNGLNIDNLILCGLMFPFFIGIPILIITKHIWYYYLFKYSLATNLLQGQEICNILAKAVTYGFIVISLLNFITFVYFHKEEQVLYFIVISNIIFIVIFNIGMSILKMELTRVGIKAGFKTLAGLINN